MTLGKLLSTALVLSSSFLLLAFVPAKGNPKAAPPASSSGDERHCVPVGGMVMTNFGAIDQATTLGYATGDLKGAVGATLLGNPQPGPGGTFIFRVQHHWVTESGDAINVDPAIATTVPIPNSSTLFAVVTYPIRITGGTGKFAGATGNLTNIGEADLVKGTVFRYSGQVCFADPEDH